MAEKSNTESQRRRRDAAYRRGFEDGRASELHGTNGMKPSTFSELRAAIEADKDGHWNALGVLAAGFAVFSVVMAGITGPKRYNRAKVDRYESGIEPSPLPEGGGKISIRYFIIAMLFIVFDIEIIFLYPFAVAFDSLGWFALAEMAIFMITVFIAYAYVWRRGGLEWD